MHGFASLLRAQRTETVLTNLAWASVGIRHTTRSSQTGGGGTMPPEEQSTTKADTATQPHPDANPDGYLPLPDDIRIIRPPSIPWHRKLMGLLTWRVQSLWLTYC